MYYLSSNGLKIGSWNLLISIVRWNSGSINTSSNIFASSRKSLSGCRWWLQSVNNFRRKFSSRMSESMTLFEGEKDRFNGITVDSLHEPCDDSKFSNVLKESLVKWKETGVRGVWFKVALQNSSWVPHLAANEFRFHHAKPSYVMMVRWLPENEDCYIPQFAHTMIGVGAIVENDKRQILVISERWYERPHWKLPGGYVEPGEELTVAAEREVLEETSIRAKFNMLVCFRHITQSAMFGCSDIYYIVALTPEPGQEVIKKCEREIAAAKWMDIDEYLNHPNVHSTNRFIVKKYLEYKASGISLSCHQDIHPLLKKPYSVYSLELGPFTPETSNELKEVELHQSGTNHKL